MLQKKALVDEQYRFINYFMWNLISILFVYAIIGFVYNQIYPPVINTATIIVMIIVVILINKTQYDFDTFGKRAVFIFLLLGYFNIIFIWEYTQIVFVFFIISLICISYIFSFKSTIYFTIAFLLVMISMIIGTKYYSFTVIKNPSVDYILTVNYYTIILSLSMNLVNIYCFMRMYKLKVEIALLEEIDKREQEQVLPYQTVNNETEDIKIYDKFDDLYKEIIDYFDTEKPWRDNDFNLNKLTMVLKSNVVYVSGALNQKGNKSFKTLVNEYRINQVKTAIKNHEHKRYTLKHIYTEAGFVNQSTFNRTFKQMENISPQEYIEREAAK